MQQKQKLQIICSPIIISTYLYKHLCVVQTIYLQYKNMEHILQQQAGLVFSTMSSSCD